LFRKALPLQRKWGKTNYIHLGHQSRTMLPAAEPFKIPRPARQPVSVRLDPFDISMLKRFARKKWVPQTQLMATWLHERIEQEKEIDPN